LHPHHLAASALILPVIVVTFGYITACAVWPFGTCRKCSGSGRHRSPSGRAFRYCHRCKGTGARLRTGRRIWNYLRNLHKEGHR
jgi:hypothetical protein